MVVDGAWEPRIAETVADGALLAVSVPVVAENATLLFPEVTVTLAGTTRAAFVLCSATVVLTSADSFRETVHVDVALEPIEEGLQAMDVTETGASRRETGGLGTGACAGGQHRALGGAQLRCRCRELK